MPLPITSNPSPAQASSWSRSRPLKRAAILLVFFTALYLIVFSQPELKGHASLFPERMRPNWRTSKPVVSLDSSLGSARNPDRSAKPRAAFVLLVRERQLNDLLHTLRDVHWAFNDDLEHGYDFVFLSETPFTPWFQEHINDFLSKRPSQPRASFGLVPKEDWDIPAHIDMVKARERWHRMSLSGRIPYGGSKSYRQMCRYMSGPIYQHPLLKDLDYAWRLEPETKHLCTYHSHWKELNGRREWVERDPFRYMRDNKKRYAWTISMLEYRATVMTLMVKVNWWRRDNPEYIAANNSYPFVSNDGKGYNNCHFWTNFEIIDLSFVRSPAYTSFFKALDQSGGFFYERWGDAPVRSIAASMMLNRSEIWQMDYVGYYHAPYGVCPVKTDPGQSCACDPQTSTEYDQHHVTCRAKWDRVNGVDPDEVVHSLNAMNGEKESFKEGEEHHMITPFRLMRPLHDD